MEILAQNKRAFRDYEILEKYEAGISLQGQEVKSIKAKRINLKGSYVILKGKEFFLVGANVPPWQPKNAPKDYNPQRPRKLLLKKSEILSLIGKKQQKGLTFIPLRVYTKRGLIKIEFALAKGKKKKDKREKIKKEIAKREIERAMKLGMQ